MTQLNCSGPTFAADEGGGINSATHNGYVRDCTSLGPDVVPEQGPATVFPRAVSAKAHGKPAKLGAKKATAALATSNGKASFYSGMM
eukprot:CAMPEP_0196757516 /NCGR_PEP_ID=MMETSP1091-20130531/103707_1 /TAXON_ID=302021 /ORGANISM="Rhodomonas sp., Strain CCMP768" /LENGTH=86 /DNA_ID=CAMNT_0042106295 /DNA_START=109 /DNA_END=369 /DNA_ORIENTATION=+